jgi:hypothetical protein
MPMHFEILAPIDLRHAASDERLQPLFGELFVRWNQLLKIPRLEGTGHDQTGQEKRTRRSEGQGSNEIPACDRHRRAAAARRVAAGVVCQERGVSLCGSMAGVLFGS